MDSLGGVRRAHQDSAASAGAHDLGGPAPPYKVRPGSLKH